MALTPLPGPAAAGSSPDSGRQAHPEPALQSACEPTDVQPGQPPERQNPGGGSPRKRRYGPQPSDTPTAPLMSLLVCYDIADDAIRLRVSNILSRFGPRVQLSTFECRVSTRRELAKLIDALKAEIDPACDQIRVYNFGTRPSAPTILGQRELEEWVDYMIL